MALRMPRPITNASGVYHLNIRVPGDVAAKVKGTVVTLPVAGAQVTVRPSDKVIVSLRTKDPSLAKARFCEAESALSRHWDALRRGPVSLTHVQLVALAGECYRATVKAFEDDPNYMPEGYLRAARQFEADVAYWRKNGDDDAGDIGERDGLVLACLARPRGPQLLAYERSRDLNEFGIAVTYDDAISDLFGPEADELCRVRHIEVDAPTRLRLIREIAQAYRLLDRKLIRNAEGDYSPDENASRFPPFVPPPVKAAAPPSRSSRGGGVGMQRLFDRWREVHGPSLAASTLRRYGPAVTSLDVHTKGKDVRSLSEDDIWDWAHARVAGGASARTVNRNELVAIASILGWATTRDGKRLRADNPARGVKLPEPKRRVLRARTFRSAEVTAILTLARSVTPDPTFAKAAAGRRWVPWICAYSGARVQEVLHLEKVSIWHEGDGVGWVMHFPMTKDGWARTVPVHEHLVEEGLVDYWRAAGPGHLFMFDRPPKSKASRSRQEMRASELAEWVQKHVDLGEGVSPNHGWRHSFSTNAEAAGVPKRISTALTGHNKKKDASDGYVTPSLGQLREAMDRFPRYRI